MSVPPPAARDGCKMARPGRSAGGERLLGTLQVCRRVTIPCRTWHQSSPNLSSLASVLGPYMENTGTSAFMRSCGAKGRGRVSLTLMLSGFGSLGWGAAIGVAAASWISLLCPFEPRLPKRWWRPLGQGRRRVSRSSPAILPTGDRKASSIDSHAPSTHLGCLLVQCPHQEVFCPHPAQTAGPVYCKVGVVQTGPGGKHLAVSSCCPGQVPAQLRHGLWIASRLVGCLR